MAVGHLGERATGLDPHPLHVDLLVRRVESAALHPAVAEARVLHEAVAVGVGGRREAPGLEDRGPGLLEEGAVAGGAEVVAVHDHVERRGVGAVPGVGILGEPRHERGALRDLVGELAVVPLEAAQERKGECGSWRDRRRRSWRERSRARRGRRTTRSRDARSRRRCGSPRRGRCRATGWSTRPLSMPTLAQAKARSSLGSGVASDTVPASSSRWCSTSRT